MSKETESVVTVLGAGCLVVLLLAGASIVQGFVLAQMWAWFVVPLFHLPALSVAAAIGLALTVGMVTRNSEPEDKDKSTAERLITSLIKAFLAPVITLAMGWIVKGFI